MEPKKIMNRSTFIFEVVITEYGNDYDVLDINDDVWRELVENEVATELDAEKVVMLKANVDMFDRNEDTGEYDIHRETIFDWSKLERLEYKNDIE